MTDERFATISGLLKSPPRTRTPLRVPDEPDGDTASESPAQPVQTPHPTPAAKARADRVAQPRSASSEGGTQRVVLRLRAPLHTQLVTHVAATRSSQGDVVLDAIEAAYTAGRLADLVAHAHDVDQGTLFARTKKRGPAEASIPIELRLRREAVTEVDRLAAETHADSRTQLIVVALEAHLNHSVP